ncbi:MAG: diguanylate cyclase domain-containing protein [Pseudomonadota bacterium]
MLDIQPLTTRRLTPAVLSLLGIATSLPVFGWHWYSFDRLLAQPGLEQVARPQVLAGLNGLVLAAIVLDVVLVAWLWFRRHRPEPMPYIYLLVVMVQVVTYCAMGIAFGPVTSPLSSVFISALAIGLALLGRRPTVIGFVAAVVLLALSDCLVLTGLVPYAPALVPGTFQGGLPVAWWAHSQGVLFFTSLIFGLVLCDADHFKRINDTYGHQAGDLVLQDIGRLLAGGLRLPGDVAARLGGEEFALLLTDCREAEAAAVCERLRRQLAAQALGGGGASAHSPGAGRPRPRVTLSMGAVECRHGSTEAALKAADVNLYRAKSAGRDRVVMTVQEAAP